MSQNYPIKLETPDVLNREIEAFLEEMSGWDDIDISQQDSASVSDCETTPFMVLYNQVLLENELGINSFGSKFALELVTTPPATSSVISNSPEIYDFLESDTLMTLSNHEGLLSHFQPQEIIAPVIPTQSANIKPLSPSPCEIELPSQVWGLSSDTDYFNFKQSSCFMPSPLPDIPFEKSIGAPTLNSTQTPLYNQSVYGLEFKTPFQEDPCVSQLPSPPYYNIADMLPLMPIVDRNSMSTMDPTLLNPNTSSIPESNKSCNPISPSARTSVVADNPTMSKITQCPKQFYILEPYQYSDVKVDRRSFNSRKELKQAKAQAQPRVMNFQNHLQ